MSTPPFRPAGTCTVSGTVPVLHVGLKMNNFEAVLRIRDVLSRIRQLLHPGSRIRGVKKHRIPDPDTQHCLEASPAEEHWIPPISRWLGGAGRRSTVPNLKNKFCWGFQALALENFPPIFKRAKIFRIFLSCVHTGTLSRVFV
jgi:hypothetical protein